MSINRRQFIKRTTAAASMAPFILPSDIWGAETKPSEQITIGMIGMGKQGNSLLGGCLGHRDCRVVAVSEVDTTRREAAQKRINDHYTNKDCAAYNDFRRIIERDDIDAVCIATPDHWHAIPTLAAMRAGKDVYCEKPLTHNIAEALEIMKVAEAKKNILQSGSMQRSSWEFRTSCELVQNGIIGKLEKVEVFWGRGPGIPCDLPEEEMEPGLDWNMWLGPAPKRPYNSILSPRGCHNNYPNWRYYKEYGGGDVCDWGPHHLDIAHWGMGMDDSGPVKVMPPEDPNATHGAVLTYPNGLEVTTLKGGGTKFYGSGGEIYVNRGRFSLTIGDTVFASYKQGDSGTSLGAQLTKAEKEFLVDAKVKLYVSKNHIWNFLDCVKSRQKSITNDVIGSRTAIACHLINLAYYNHQEVRWDPKKLEFPAGVGDNSWYGDKYREPWKI